MTEPSSAKVIAGRILTIRGERVMLDADLARLYGVKTERLNQQVRRNLQRFPAEYMFKLTEDEWRAMFLQNARTSQGRRRLDRLPLAFTEHGCVMLSNVLNSPRAVEVSVQIVEDSGRHPPPHTFPRAGAPRHRVSGKPGQAG
jgi:hypothetical protein